MKTLAKLRLATLVVTSVSILGLPDLAFGEPAATDLQKGASLRSAGQLAFGPGNVLFVADSLGASVYAFDVADKGAPSEEMPAIDAIDEKLAALLGTEAKQILIRDIAVHPSSKAIYVSISRGTGVDAAPVLARVDGSEKFTVIETEGAAFTKVELPNAPAADATTRRGQPKRTLTITDIAFHDGYLYVAGLSNEEFASSLRKIPYPFTGTVTSTSVEIFHGAHGKYETHAPIRTLMPYVSKGEAHLLASYTCTPLVTFPIDKLADGSHVKGSTIAELGFGNSPLDMIQFDKGGVPYILILNSSRGGMRIKASDIETAGSISADVDITRDAPTAGVPYITVPMGGVLRADVFDEENLVVLRRDVIGGGLQLRVWKTAWI